MQVGPFFLFERVAFKEAWYRGQPATDIDLTVAIAYWGEVQIELIRQRNQVPSIYTDFEAQGATGLQHMGVMSEDLDADLARLKAHGVRRCSTAAPPACASPTSNTDHHPGGMVELIEATPKARAFFERIRRRRATGTGATPS